MVAFLISVVMQMLVSLLAQQSGGDVSEQMITVPLSPGEGLEYEIQFIPSRDGVRAIASRFCDERKSDFNITNEYINNCLEPIIIYLDNVVANKNQAASDLKKDVVVPLKVAEFEYEINFRPSVEAAMATAEQFCTQRGGTFGITNENYQSDCLVPIGDYFKKALQEHITKYSNYELPAQPSLFDDIKLMMEISGITFEISWNSKNAGPGNMARRFCLAHAEKTLNIDYTACVLPVEEYLINATTKPDKLKERKMIKAVVNIAGEDFEFKFGPEDHEALRAAKEFCVENASALGVREDTMGSQCVQPILITLLEAVEKAEVKRRERLAAKKADQDILDQQPDLIYDRERDGP